MSSRPIHELTVEELEKRVEFHDHQYFHLHSPLISDEDYDLLVRRLKQLRPESPVLQRVGGATPGRDQFGRKVEHAHPMLSLDKCYSPAEFESWLKMVARSIKVLAENAAGSVPGQYAPWALLEKEDDLLRAMLPQEVLVSPKVDGVAASLRYGVDGALEQAATRGNGLVGEDFTINARAIQGIPLQLSVGSLEVRGEVHMRNSVFRERYAQSFSNPRNLTAGTLKQKESSREQLLDLTFAAYDLQGLELETEEQKVQRLAELGFLPVESIRMAAAEVPAFYERALANRSAWDFDADGIVMKLNDSSLQGPLGITAHHPRWAIAYKFQGDTGFSTLKGVEWSVSRSGIITPVATVDPVFLSGAQVSRCSLHNIARFAQHQLRLGDEVQVTRRGGVIPNLEASLGGGDELVEVPGICPSCGAETTLLAPQVFVAGYRTSRDPDEQELDALWKRQKYLGDSIVLASPMDAVNIVSRRNGDVAFKEALTWKTQGFKNQEEKEAAMTKKKAVTTRISSLPGAQFASCALYVFLVTDSNSAFSREVAGRVQAWATSRKVSVRVLELSMPADAETESGREWAEKLSDNLLMCSHPAACPGSRMGLLEYFIKTMGVDDFGEKLIETLFRSGLLREREDFYKLKLEDLLALDRVGEILGRKLLDNVAAASRVDLATFLESLGIPALARQVSSQLASRFSSIDEILGLSEESMDPPPPPRSKPTRGVKTATPEKKEAWQENIAFSIAHQVVQGLRKERTAIEGLLRHVTLVEPSINSTQALTGHPLSGKSVVFTGKMAQLQRKEAQEKVRACGGLTPEDVTKDLDILVIGDEGSPLFGAGTKGNKQKKADKLVASGASLRIISESDFLKLLEEKSGPFD